MKVLITGATGFLGSHVAEELLRRGHTVRALVRRSSKVELLTKLGVELAYANLEKGEGLDDALAGVDAVVHSAGLVKARSPEEFYEVNVQGTINLLQAAQNKTEPLARFLYISSLAAHGFSDTKTPRGTYDEPRPVTNYGRSKLQGEQATVTAKDTLSVAVLRPPAIYGPRDTEMFAFFQMISKRVMSFLGNADHQFSLIYVEDCARAAADILESSVPSGRIYFVEDGAAHSQREFADAVSNALGVKPLKLTVPMAVIGGAAVFSELYGKVAGKAMMLTRDKINELGHPYLVCQSDDIRRDLGWAPRVPLADGVRTAAKWYRDNNWI